MQEKLDSRISFRITLQNYCREKMPTIAEIGDLGTFFSPNVGVFVIFTLKNYLISMTLASFLSSCGVNLGSTTLSTPCSQVAEIFSRSTSSGNSKV